MKNNLTKITAVALVFALAACNENEEERVESKDISKLGAIETTMTTEHVNDSIDVLVTNHKVWKNNQLIREFAYRDTVPALGVGTIEAADNQGEATNVMAKKDYEFYITVK